MWFAKRKSNRISATPGAQATAPPDAQTEHDGVLREFVYLDEVSVNSLLASRDGHVVSQLTDSQASLLEAEIKATAGTNAGVFKAEVTPRLMTSRNAGSQVIRKSIVQSAFKDLYDPQRDSLMFRVSDRAADMPKVECLVALEKLAKDDRARTGWVLTNEDLVRGSLAEVVIELEAEPLFRFRSVLSTVLPVLLNEASILDPKDQMDLQQPAAMGRVLDQMLAGLVPLRSKLTDFQWVKVNGSTHIVHNHIVKQLSADPPLETGSVYVVGVAEDALFWKDLRRTLFSRSRFSALLRISRDGLQLDWTPVKLVDVLRSVAPGIGDKLENSLKVLEIADAGDGPGNESDLDGQMKAALTKYVELVASQHGQASPLMTAETLQEHVAMGGTLQTTAERKAAFKSMDEAMSTHFGVSLDGETALTLRTQALQASGLGTTPETNGSTEAVVRHEHPASDRLVETEFIAIYW